MRSEPPRRTVVVLPSVSRSCRVTTSVPPASRPPCTPGSGVTSLSPSGPHVQSPIEVGSVLARNSTTSPSTSATSRTCSDGGVTGSPSTTSLRAPSASTVVTSAPAAVWAGTPGTMSTHTGSVCSVTRVVAPVATSTRSVRRAFWSRGCTTTISPCSSQTASATYSSRAASQPDRGARAVEREDLQRHAGVGRAGGGVGDDGGRAVRVGGVGDVPAPYRAVVHPCDEQRLPVRGPPVPAHPAHLLGRDEVGEPVGDVWGVRLGDRGGGARGDVVDVQRAAAHVRDPAAVRVGPRVDHAAGRLHQPRGAARGEVGDVELPGQRERRHRDRPVRRVARRHRRPAPGCAPGAPAPPAGGPRRPRSRPARAGRPPAAPRRSRGRASTGTSPGRCRRGCAGTPHALPRGRS